MQTTTGPGAEAPGAPHDPDPPPWRRALRTGLGLLYPPRCFACGCITATPGLCGPCWADTPFLGGTLCAGCAVPLMGPRTAEAEYCDACLAHPPPWHRAAAPLRYDGTARRLVLALKHGDRLDLAGPAAAWMLAALGRLPGPPPGPGALVVPMPLHWRRRIARRYNQSALLAQRIARTAGWAYAPGALQRRRATPPLEGRGRAERQRLLAGAIRAAPRAPPLAGRDVVLVDDVATSCASLRACAAALAPLNPGKIYVLVLARVAPPD